MSFNFFGKSSRPRREREVEDVAYEEVRTEAPRGEMDKAMRNRQIADAVLAEVREMMYKSPTSGLITGLLFVHGAEWADAHPAGAYESEDKWCVAAYDAAKELAERAASNTELKLMLMLAFNRGAEWAKAHPAVEK